MLELTYDEYVSLFGTEKLEKMDIHSADDVETIMCVDNGNIFIVFGRMG
jgi:hypothetical protein